MVLQLRRHVTHGTTGRLPKGKIEGRFDSFDLSRGFGWISVLTGGDPVKVTMDAVYGANMFPPKDGDPIAFKIGGTHDAPLAVELEPIRV